MNLSVVDRATCVHEMDLKEYWPFLIAAWSLFRFASGQLDASQTVIWGDALTEVHAGEISVFYLQTRDASGNPVEAETTDISVLCVSESAAPDDFCVEDPKITISGVGEFRVEFVVGRFWARDLDPWIEGIFPNPLPDDFFSQTEDKIRVTVGGDHVPGSPFSPRFYGEDEIDPSESVVTISTYVLYAGLPGGLGELQRIRDSFGNEIRPANLLERITGSLTLEERAFSDLRENDPPEVTVSWILTNWYIDLQTVCRDAGRYRFETLYSDGVSPTVPIPIERTIDGTRDVANVVPCVPNSVAAIEVELPGTIAPDSIVEVVAQAYDAYRNAAFFGSAVTNGVPSTPTDQTLDDVEVSLVHASCDCPLVNSLDTALNFSIPGRLVIQFSSSAEGTHRLQISYKGVEYVHNNIEVAPPAAETEPPTTPPAADAQTPAPSTPMSAEGSASPSIESSSTAEPSSQSELSEPVADGSNIDALIESPVEPPDADLDPSATAETVVPEGSATQPLDTEHIPETAGTQDETVHTPEGEHLSTSSPSQDSSSDPHESPITDSGAETQEQSPDNSVSPAVSREVDPNATEVEVPFATTVGEISIEAGEKRLIYVHLKDTHGVPVEGELVELAGWMINRATPEKGLLQLERSAVASPVPGVYSLEITGQLAGVYDLLITYKGVPVENNFSTAIIQPSREISLTRSIVEGLALGVQIGENNTAVVDQRRQTAGHNMSLLVAAVDPFGNPHTTTKPGFHLNSELWTAATWMTTFEFGDGITRFYFSIQKTGIYRLRVSFRSEDLYESNLEVRPADVSASNCNVFGLNPVQAGDWGYGYLQVRDAFNNIYDATYRSLIDLAPFQINLHRTSDDEQIEPKTVQFTGFAPWENAIQFRYNVTHSGTYAIAAKWHQYPVPGDGDEVIVDPGSLSFSHTRAALAHTTVQAGEEVRFLMEARDRFDNLAAKEQQLDQRVRVWLSHSTEGLEERNWNMQVSATGDGTLEAFINVTEARDYTVRLSIDGIGARIADDSVRVLPGRFDVAKSTLVWNRRVSVEVWNDVIVFPRDRFENAVAIASDLKLEVGHPTAEIHGFSETGVPGQISARFKLHEAGNYSLAISYMTTPTERLVDTIIVVENQQEENSNNTSDLQVAQQTLTNISSNQASSSSSEQWWEGDASVIVLFVLCALLVLVVCWIYSSSTSVKTDSDSDCELAGTELHTHFRRLNVETKEEGDQEDTFRIRACRPELS